MNKELIERLALEAYEKQMNQELRPQDKPGVFGVCEEFLSAVDAERRKEAACWQFQDTDGSWHYFVDERHKENTIAAGYPVRPLFLAPQIPEGMVPRNPEPYLICGDIAVSNYPQYAGWVFVRHVNGKDWTTGAKLTPETWAMIAAAGVAP